MNDHVLLLGEIKGRLDHIQNDQGVLLRKLEQIDGRLRSVEARSAVHGAGAGAAVALVVAVGTALIKDTLAGS